MSPHPTAPPTDIRDMIVVHTALLREFRLAPRAVARATDRTRRRVAGHVGFLCDVLDHHHQGEDELLWPLLEARAADDAQRWVIEMHEQHERLEHDLAGVRRALAAWSDGASGVPLQDALVTLYADLAHHLDHEEREILPVVAVTVTEQEWRELGERAVAHLPKSRLPLLFGMMMYEGDPAVIAQMLTQVPAVPRTLLPRLAPRLYARHARRLLGTPTP